MTAVNLPATFVETTVDPITFLVQTTVDSVAFTVQAVRQTIPAGRVGTIRFAIETPVDAIAVAIQTVLNSITAIVESILDAITRVGPNGATDNQKTDRNNYCFPDIHFNSPLYPYEIVLSVGTTRKTPAR